MKKFKSLYLRRQESDIRTDKSVGSMFSRVSSLGNKKKSVNCNNELMFSVEDEHVRNSVTTDTNSSVDENSPSELDEHNLQEALIRHFEDEGKAAYSKSSGPIDMDLLDDDYHYYDSEKEEDNSKNIKGKYNEQDAKKALTRSFERDEKSARSHSTGLIDLDLLDDDFHFYDDEDEVESNKKSNIHEEQQSGYISRDRGNQPVNVAEGTTKKNIARQESFDRPCDAMFSDGEEIAITDDRNMQRKSAPIDTDDVYDLETTFDSILNEHEDNFMIWTSNRKSINAILNAEEKAAARRSQRYGLSLRRERKSSRWSPWSGLNNNDSATGRGSSVWLPVSFRLQFVK